jgi:flagellar M-ring protein FliF
VNGISNLVAASVEGLRPEAVVILDSFGRPLARPQDDSNDPLGAAASERQQRLEQAMSQRVVALLEPVVGADHVRVNVSMKLNPATREETEERWDPNAVVRSKQSSADQASSPSAAGMVAGSRGNMPPEPKPQQPPVAKGNGAPAAATEAPQVAAVSGSSRSTETTNYEISRTTRHVIEPPGEVAKLSVAVIIDDDQVAKTSAQGEKTFTRKPRTREELQKMQGLVAAAVGLEPDRGDQLTVENIAFDEQPVEAAPPVTVLQRYTPEIKEGSRVLVIVAIALVALLFVVRPLVAGVGGRVAARADIGTPALVRTVDGKPVKTVADMENEIERQLDAAAIEGADRKLPVLTKRVAHMSMNEPENIARLLRTWMNEQER